MTAELTDRERRREMIDEAVAKMSDDEIAERLEELRAEDSPLPLVASPAPKMTTIQAVSATPNDLLKRAESAERMQQALEIVESLPAASSERRDIAADAAALRIAGIDPCDAVEQMLATQMLALHSATLDCVRRAMLPDQPGPFRREELNLAAKASRTFAHLADTLDRRRRGGQQKVTVEHVHVHAGGQAIVGTVEAGGQRNGDK